MAFHGGLASLTTGTNAAGGVTVTQAVDGSEVLGFYIYATHGGGITQTVTYTEDTLMSDGTYRTGPAQTLVAAGTALTSAASTAVWSHRHALQLVGCDRVSVTFTPSGATTAYGLGFWIGAQK